MGEGWTKGGLHLFYHLWDERQKVAMRLFLSLLYFRCRQKRSSSHSFETFWPLMSFVRWEKKHPHLLPCGRLCGEDPRKQSPRVHTSTWSSHFLRKLQSQRNLADGLWKRRRAPVVSVCPFEVVVSYRSWWFPQKCWLKRYSCIERGSPAIWSLISEAPSPAISDISQAMTNQG